MKLETPFTHISRSADEVFAVINEPARFSEFMPSAVSGFKSGEDFGMPWFAFTIGGMPEIKMVRTESIPTEKILYSTPMGAKISLGLNIQKESPAECSVQVYIDADVNPMLRMMVERPLRQFLNDVTDKIKAIQ